jgi:hypothetical protein
MPGDNRMTAENAIRYLPDSRAQHFWDLWKFGSRNYSNQLGCPPEEAWDLFVLYKPHLAWRDSAPLPTLIMRARRISAGVPYSKDALETEIEKWIR